jgi:hypothetical protein
MLTMRSRKASRTTSWDSFLASFYGMHVVRFGQLHQYNLTVQYATGISADRLEDTGRVHSGIMCHRCDVHTVSFYERRKVNV